MEVPISFTVWAKVSPEMREKAISFVRLQHVFPSEIELRKAVSAAIRIDRQMQISAPLGYGAAHGLASALGPEFSDLTYCQEGYWPASSAGFCQVHNFYFGGCLGCHVCSGFFRP
ncbi:hypothetical protein AACH06_29620 [Ideonella sp. DXS29W]|uniref:Uncharacterized protein n=1 Tax=Ideonella lacteola TaxID=2984193 RepID=A0ABU9C1R0_9BURK